MRVSILLAAALLALLAGCGKRPAFPIPAEGVADQYPRLYPNPMYDPQPGNPPPAPTPAESDNATRMGREGAVPGPVLPGR